MISSRAGRIYRLRIVLLTKGGFGERRIVAVNGNEAACDILRRLKEAAGASLFESAMQRIIGKKEALFQGFATPHRHTDLEADSAVVFVNLDQLEFLPHLTYAYHNPHKLPDWADFLQNNARFHDPIDAFAEKHIVLVRGWKTDLAWTRVLLSLSAIFSVAVGVVVGFKSSDAGIGVTVSSAVVALFSFVAFVTANC